MGDAEPLRAFAMPVSLRASLLAVVLLTALLPLGALAYLELRELGQDEQAYSTAEFENVALALAVRGENAARDGEDPLVAAAAAAPEERVLLVSRDGTWRAPDGARGQSAELARAMGDKLSGVAEVPDPATQQPARVAWARVPDADASVMVVRPPAPPVAPVDWTFLALLGSLAAGAIAMASILTWLVVRPVHRLEQASRRFADGQWEERASVAGAREVRSLAVAFNAMAADLAALQEARARRLAQKSADLEALHFAMAHEVREPLRSIRWMLDDALESRDPDPLRLARRRVDEVDRILQDLMRYEDVAVRDAPVAEVDVGQALDRAWEEAGGRVRVEREGDLPRVVGNADLLVAAFAEILRNAAQHGASRVIVRPRADEEWAWLAFDDDGPGVPAARREDALHLFQRFHRADGTGVGLAIVRRVAERHGGEARLDDAPDGGLRVELRLPLEGPLDAREPVEAPPRRRF